MSRAGKLVCLVGGTLAVCAVAAFYFAMSDRLGARPRAQLLRMKINGKEVDDVAMLIDQTECRKFLKKQSQDWDEIRRKYPKAKLSVDLTCVPEDDSSVPAKWKAPTRIGGKLEGCDVYYYHEPEPQTLAGAFVLALPDENEQSDVEIGRAFLSAHPEQAPIVEYKNLPYDEHEPEIGEIYVDQRTCDTQLAANKEAFQGIPGSPGDAEHDPNLKELERAALGGCIPIANAMPLVNRFCDGLPLKLAVESGKGIYSCDRNIVRPAGAAIE
jgi:hypothetical protein